MAKVGILTFHQSNNTGAFIQCYALVNKLKTDFPDHDFEVIDYSTHISEERKSWRVFDYIKSNNVHNKKDSPSYFYVILTNIIRLIRHPNILHYKKLENDIFDKARGLLPLSEMKLVTDNIQKFNYIYNNIYDVIIVGSDCVWQYCSYPFPNAYLLHDNISKFKLSYAACAYRMRIEDMKERDVSYMKDALASFAYLGVRDIETEKIANKLGLSYVHNCDPSIFLDFSSLPINISNFRCSLEEKGVDFRKKIVGIQTCDSIIGKWVKSILNTEEYQIISIRCYNEYADLNILDINPFEWAVIFRFFYFTVSDFFHANILSLLNGRLCLAIDTGNYNEGIDSRLSDVLNRLNLKQYYIKRNLGDEPILQIKNIINAIIEKEGAINPHTIFENERNSYFSFKAELKNILDSL